MENRYDRELLELRKVYVDSLSELNMHREKHLDRLVVGMGEFLKMYGAVKTMEKKLEVLNCKLETERAPCCGNEVDGCECKEEDETDE